ncbi:acyl-CoA dehydrogenase family protein [Aestuariirhabdus sp. Z084]|uniref:acyl-CoA dehydrogenase family protein n=1 Tax=Aestuariirhabdus haliotis TaxID=2918751 RepID=UPI00201B3E00|nr:acyl-CoA dehydrogenase family protein [Aestuariirhabdus haliotis]MCL6416904.1 acyl-CoA dehydrogenase family protein [Aestuariirhabdus haliotis]MCL6420877.1 acyl-CoA dehydrogenase family protein [Aestuariirhabdus haliotis]
MSELQQYFGESQQMIRSTVKKFIDREVKPFIDQWEEAEEFPLEIYRKAGELGILGIGYPEALGGSEGDLFDKVAASEEIMRAGSGGFAAGLGSLDIGLPPVVKWGSDELKQRIVPQVLAGEKIMALAITEPSGGSDVANLKTRAVREGDYFRLTGSKTFITSGVRADYYTVAVRTGGEGYGGISLILVEKGTPGFSVGRKLKKGCWWASDTAELFFDDCKVPVENLIGAENQGFYAIMSNFQSERLQLAIMANMTSELALNACLEYVREREAFGRPIGRFQVIKHKLADMATQLEASREFTYRQAARMNAGQTVIKEISMAKNFSTDVSDKITYEAVQIFGGYGLMRESLVERLYRDNRILSIGGGTREIMNEIITKQMGL